LDISNLLIGGLAVTFATVASVLENRTYKLIEELCKNYGFTEFVMGNRSLRRKAKIYAVYNKKMDEFEIALDKYNEKGNF